MLNRLIAGEGFGKEGIRAELDKLQNFLIEKQKIGEGVHTFQRLEGNKKGWEEIHNQVAGLFHGRSDEAAHLQQEDEEDTEGKEDKNKEAEQFKSSIKSKKAFSLAINDKTMPSSIKHLSNSANIILVILIVLAIAEYTIIYQHLTEARNNFTLIEKSYLRTAEIQKVVYNCRSMILLNKG